jgi:hypothetical protein
MGVSLRGVRVEMVAVVFPGSFDKKALLTMCLQVSGIV